MTINHVSSSQANAAHAPNPQPAKKSNVNFNDLLNAGMAVQPQATTPTPVTSATPSTSTAKA